MAILAEACRRDITLRKCSVRPCRALLLAIATAQRTSIKIDATLVESHVSPSMHAAFVELMAEGVKWA